MLFVVSVTWLMGGVARKLHAESKIGPILDSVADLSFVVCCAIRLLLLLLFPKWLCIWAGIIVIIKIVNQISALIVIKKFYFLHTTANKLTGFLLFFAVPTICLSIVPIAIVATIATYAAIQERHFIRLQARETHKCLVLKDGDVFAKDLDVF